MNFLPAVPARHVAAFREGESVAATHILGTGLSDRPTRGRRHLCLPNNQSVASEDGRSPTGKMSVLRLFPPRRSCAKAGVLRAIPLCARDELVRRMRSPIFSRAN